jgi:hypothetical protein
MGASGQRHAPAVHLPPGKGPPVPIRQEAGEPVWTQRLEEESSAPVGDRTPISRSSNPYSDTILPELTRLLLRRYFKQFVLALYYERYQSLFTLLNFIVNNIFLFYNYQDSVR